MAQLSRPYQIALAALLVLALAWFALARRHGSPSEASSSSTPASTSASTPSHTPAASGGSTANPSLGAEEAKKAATPSPIYHGAAPGVEGLSRAVARAHGAVATSQAEAKKAEATSAQSTGESPQPSSTTSSSTTSSPGASPTAGSGTSAAKPATPATVPAKPQSATERAAEAATPSGQRQVEAALAAGKVPVVLFWNPEGADDVAVHGQLQGLSHGRLPIAVYEGDAEAVASFGAITREVPVYGTPTILIVAKNGQTTELTGLQEHFSIERAIEEALHA